MANGISREDWLESQLDLSNHDYRTRFIANVTEARDDGCELCCVFCGIGDDILLAHEDWCPCAGEKANEDALAKRTPPLL